MHNSSLPEFSPQRLAVIGISHQEASLAVRERYVLNAESRKQLYSELKKSGLPFCLILSTCNRTEIYTDIALINTALKLWLDKTTASDPDKQLVFNLKGADAVRHLFSVTSGTASQIPGDMQITQQVMQAFEEAKAHHLTHGLFEKLINQAMSCSKRVKSETKLSQGISSVPSAVTMLVRKHLRPHDRISILGIGSIGKISCHNLVKSVPADQITVINRTFSRSLEFVHSLGVNAIEFENKDEVLTASDILIVSTSSPAPLITSSHCIAGKRKLILDLSVPSGVDPEVHLIPGVTVMNIDTLSQLVETHIDEREGELSQAKQIIEEEMKSSDHWWQRRHSYLKHHTIIPMQILKRKNA